MSPGGCVLMHRDSSPLGSIVAWAAKSRGRGRPFDCLVFWRLQERWSFEAQQVPARLNYVASIFSQWEGSSASSLT